MYVVDDDSAGLIFTMIYSTLIICASAIILKSITLVKNCKKRMAILRQFPRNKNFPERSHLFGLVKRHDIGISADHLPLIQNMANSSKGSKVPGLSYVEVVPGHGMLVCENIDVADAIWRSSSHVDKGGVWESAVESVCGGVLVILKGQEWRDRRKMLSKSFHNDLMNSFYDCFNSQCKTMIYGINLKLGDNHQAEIKCRRFANDVALDIAAECLFGVSLDIQKHRHETGKPTYFQEVYENNMGLFMKRLHPLYCRDWLWRLLQNKDYTTWKDGMKKTVAFLKDVIDKRRHILAKNESEVEHTSCSRVKLCIIDTLLREEQAGNLNEKQIVGEMIQFFLAGHDTSAATLDHSIAYLAHPKSKQYTEKLQAEIDEYFPDKDDLHVTPEKLSKMDYLDLVVREILRLCGPAAAVSRRLSAPLKINDDLVLPFDETIPTDVFLLLLPMQRSKKYFGEDADEFCPERFLRLDVDTRAECAFAKGPRNCIGKQLALTEIKVMIIYLLRNYDIECTEDLVNKKLEMSMMVKFVEEPLVRFKKRDK